MNRLISRMSSKSPMRRQKSCSNMNKYQQERLGSQIVYLDIDDTTRCYDRLTLTEKWLPKDEIPLSHEDMERMLRLLDEGATNYFTTTPYLADDGTKTYRLDSTIQYFAQQYDDGRFLGSEMALLGLAGLGAIGAGRRIKRRMSRKRSARSGVQTGGNKKSPRRKKSK